MGEGFFLPSENWFKLLTSELFQSSANSSQCLLFSACLLTAVLISFTLTKVSNLKNVISTNRIAMSLAQLVFLLTSQYPSEGDRETESLVTSQNVYSASIEALDCL